MEGGSHPSPGGWHDLFEGRWLIAPLSLLHRQPNQPVFDFYSDFYLRAIELGTETDPPMLPGNNYGVSLDSHGHLSDYPG